MRYLKSFLVVLFSLSYLSGSALAAQDSGWEESQFLAKPYSFRVAIGPSFSRLKLDFDNGGTLSGAPVTSLTEDANKETGIAFSLGAKYDFLDFFSLGVHMDYNLIPVDWSVRAESANAVFLYNGDVGDIHVLSGFLVAGIHFPLGVMVPYFQVGVGINGNISDVKDDLVDFDDDVTVGVMIGGGFEIFFQQALPDGSESDRDYSFFFEVAWHYDVADFTSRPAADSKLTGELDLATVSILFGMNFYFGPVEKPEPQPEYR